MQVLAKMDLSLRGISEKLFKVFGKATDATNPSGNDSPSTEGKQSMIEYPKGMILPDDKIAFLEKTVIAQNTYLNTFKDSVKKLNRRNTFAVMELQTLVMQMVNAHPDLAPMRDALEPKLKEILDFKKDYEVG